MFQAIIATVKGFDFFYEGLNGKINSEISG